MSTIIKSFFDVVPILDSYTEHTSPPSNPTLKDFLPLTDSFRRGIELILSDALIINDIFNPPTYNDILSINDTFKITNAKVLFNDELIISMQDEFIIASSSVTRIIKQTLKIREGFVEIATPKDSCL